MGNVFASKPLKEIVRENQRMIKKSIRELEREIKILENSEKKLIADIKKNAKANQMGAVKVMAKDLVRTRNYVTRFIEMKTHLNAVSLKMQTIKSHDAMANAMKGVTKALTKMNQKMDIPGLQKIMSEFERENEKAEATEDMIGDTLDDAMADEGSEEQENLVVGQVLDELGINFSENVPRAPVGKEAQTATAETSCDSAMSDLEARLKGLGN